MRELCRRWLQTELRRALQATPPASKGSCSFHSLPAVVYQSTGLEPVALGLAGSPRLAMGRGHDTPSLGLLCTPCMVLCELNELMLVKCFQQNLLWDGWDVQPPVPPLGSARCYCAPCQGSTQTHTCTCTHSHTLWGAHSTANKGRGGGRVQTQSPPQGELLPSSWRRGRGCWQRAGEPGHRPCGYWSNVAHPKGPHHQWASHREGTV